MGVFSKFSVGGGELVCHSRLLLPQGLAGAGFPEQRMQKHCCGNQKLIAMK